MSLIRCYLHISILYVFRGAIGVLLSQLSLKPAEYLVPIRRVILSKTLYFLSLIFLICKMRVILEPTSSSTCEKQMNYMHKMLRTGLGTWQMISWYSFKRKIQGSYSKNLFFPLSIQANV